MSKQPLIPVVLSGGAGTRLWPVSREANPKPFIQLPDGESLLHKTFVRVIDIPGTTEIMTVTNREYYFRTKDEYSHITHPNVNKVRLSYILEPEGRNTAPAIGIAALSLKEQYAKDAIMLVMPADHLIHDQEAFLKALETAVTEASEGKMVTFGIRPQTPETGYGYIETDALTLNVATKVIRFVEKPDFETAKQYVEGGRHVWNSGMFCFTVGAFLEQLSLCEPELFQQVCDCWEVSQASSKNIPYTIELDKQSFAKVPAISVDYAVMEKAPMLSVVPCDIGWSDVGSWDAISSLVNKDEAGNRISGPAMLHDVSNTYVQSEGRLVAALGVNDLMIIDTDDAVLVAHRDRVQDVRQIVKQLKDEGHESHKFHRTVHRPWGTFTVLEEGSNFKIKRIVVKPGQQLSLQMHHHRSEHWVVVRGIAKIVNGDKTLMVNTNESTYIPAGHQHRLENPGVIDLILIEVQSGDYLGEDDIVRLEDKYGRSSS